MKMGYYEYSGRAITKAKRSDIWNLWNDVRTWNQWDEDVKNVELKGNFSNDSKGVLQPTKGIKAKFVLKDVIENKQFTTITKLPLSKIIFQHEMQIKKGQLEVVHRIKLTGLLSFLFNKLFVEKSGQQLQSTVENLITMAQKNEK